MAIYYQATIVMRQTQLDFLNNIRLSQQWLKISLIKN